VVQELFIRDPDPVSTVPKCQIRIL
jgi:hypothetical protein